MYNELNTVRLRAAAASSPFPPTAATTDGAAIASTTAAIHFPEIFVIFACSMKLSAKLRIFEQIRAVPNANSCKIRTLELPCLLVGKMRNSFEMDEKVVSMDLHMILRGASLRDLIKDMIKCLENIHIMSILVARITSQQQTNEIAYKNNSKQGNS